MEKTEEMREKMQEKMARQVERVAKLAKIQLSAAEKDSFAIDFQQILNFFNQIKAADTHNLEPLINPNAEEFFAREDEACPFSGAPDVFLSNAPLTQGRLFKTPPVV